LHSFVVLLPRKLQLR